MNIKQTRVTEITSVVIDDRVELSLDDICRTCQIDQAVIVEFVEQGIVEPRAINAEPWQFSGDVLPRLVRALRLQRDFELNTAGVALALDLLGEIKSLRRRLRRFDVEEEYSHE